MPRQRYLELGASLKTLTRFSREVRTLTRTGGWRSDSVGVIHGMNPDLKFVAIETRKRERFDVAFKPRAAIKSTKPGSRKFQKTFLRGTTRIYHLL